MEGIGGEGRGMPLSGVRQGASAGAPISGGRQDRGPHISEAGTSGSSLAES